MRVVLDTNIFVSALISPKGPSSKAFGLWKEGVYDLITSSQQLEELRNVSRYARIKNRVVKSEVGSFINQLKANALMFDKLPVLDISPDPDDNVILATALVGKAQIVVTGDKADLLSLEKVGGIRILGVNTFLRLFSA